MYSRGQHRGWTFSKTFDVFSSDTRARYVSPIVFFPTLVIGEYVRTRSATVGPSFTYF